jgi:hypothetical protein
VSWYAGNLLETTYNASACKHLTIRNDLYRCEIVKPWTQCESDAQCAKGERCGEAMVPQLCVKCNTSHIGSTWYDAANVTLNVTEAMLRGQFWTKDKFYNDTGADLILTLYASSALLAHKSLSTKQDFL